MLRGREGLPGLTKAHRRTILQAAHAYARKQQCPPPGGAPTTQFLRAAAVQITVTVSQQMFKALQNIKFVYVKIRFARVTVAAHSRYFKPGLAFKVQAVARVIAGMQPLFHRLGSAITRRRFCMLPWVSPV